MLNEFHIFILNKIMKLDILKCNSFSMQICQNVSKLYLQIVKINKKQVRENQSFK